MDIQKAFHLYDIRGKYPATVDQPLINLVSQAVIKLFKPQKLAVAWDSRLSSPKLARQIPADISFGAVTTPVFYHAVIKNNCDFGFIVTASHLQEDWNGLKLVKKNALPLDQGEILQIKDYCLSPNRHSGLSRIRPVLVNPIPIYETEIIDKFKNLKFPGKIIVDTGSTFLAPIVQSIFSKLNLNFTLLSSPRNLNPLLKESRQNLSTAVKKESAILGIIYDGDGDRVVFVDKNGNLIPPTFVLGLLAKNFSKVAFDVRAGQAAHTTKHIITPAWGQELKFAMQKDPQISFAGENSGHLIFRDWYCLDDGLYASLKFLELFDLKMLTRLEKLYLELPEINFPTTDDNSTLVLEKVADYYREKGAKVSLIDGVTVETENFRFNIRPSLTEPYLRLNLEINNAVCPQTN